MVKKKKNHQPADSLPLSEGSGSGGSHLPDDFVRATRELMGEERFNRYMAACSEEPPVSIRLNPHKCLVPPHAELTESEVPWCRHAYYLNHRPNFTFDPLLHAGCYYVQEAASMFLDTVLSQQLPNRPLALLDLCAAPGGKSTLACSALPQGSMLMANEPVRSRAAILLENITKWGCSSCIVTNNYPRDYSRSRLSFDVIICDVPCSGEGMFRKDPATMSQWSRQNVEKCWQLQRTIVSDAWQCLQPGGLLVYSTCTFNAEENEENIRWLLNTFDASPVPIDISKEWGITGSLLPGFQAPVYRFIPGITRGEGLFMAAVRKSGTASGHACQSLQSLWQGGAEAFARKTGLNVMQQPLLHADAPRVELSLQQAIAYLRRESLVLPPHTPKALIEVCYQGHALGMVKNIGPRANNLYPKEWRIKSTHIKDVG